jgi:hypothetical protein
MSRVVPPNHQPNRPFAQARTVLSVATLITILAAVPVQAQRAGSSAVSRPHSQAGSKRALAAGEESTRRLMRLMDKDKNGLVSKEEFLQFMSRSSIVSTSIAANSLNAGKCCARAAAAVGRYSAICCRDRRDEKREPFLMWVRDDYTVRLLMRSGTCGHRHRWLSDAADL